MTTTTPHRPVLHFARHYVEMVIGMLVGMAALGPVWTFLWPGLRDLFEVNLLVMATNMAIGMAVPMFLRKHSWRAIAEMSTSMYLAFLLVLAPYWLGMIDAHAVMLGGHVLMFPLMLAAMLWRRHEYAH